MSLIPAQHILNVVGSSTTDALEKLTTAIDDLPPVRIVSMSTDVWDFVVFSKTRQGLTIIAVVEEV